MIIILEFSTEKVNFDSWTSSAGDIRIELFKICWTYICFDAYLKGLNET